MSTYTTNYNLEKPDSTDDFKDFRANYNSNMDIIDANLGGGGGGNVDDVLVNGVSVVDGNHDAQITDVDTVGLTSTLELGTSTADGTLDGQLQLWGGTPLFRGKATLKAHHAQTGDLTFELPASSGQLALQSQNVDYFSVVNGAVNITFSTM